MTNTSIIAYIVLTICIGYAFIYSSFSDIGSLLTQKQKYENSLEMINNIGNKKAELQAQFDAISADDKKNIATILPSTLDFVRLVSQIDAVAANYGISINQITSKEVNPPTGTSIENAAPSKPYQSSIIGFSFIASYDKFNAFISDLEKSLRVLDIRTVKLGVGEDGLYTYNVEFETYWVN